MPRISSTARPLLVATAVAAALVGFCPQTSRAQSNIDELSSGAAAAAVLMHRCEPENFQAVRQMALSEVRRRAQLLSQRDQALAMDSAERKIRAFTISSQAMPCPQLERLRVMARTWGFAHLMRD